MVSSASQSSELNSLVHLLPNEIPNPNSAISSSITIQNIGSMVLIKLTTTNYLTWSALFTSIFCRYNLTGLIDGTMMAPPKYLLDSSGNGTATLNPAYVAWFENDQNILIWINSTLSEFLIPYIVGESTAAQYLQQIEEIADALASADAPVEDSELISATLHGLPPEFDSFVDFIQFCLSYTTIDELHGLLLRKEIQLTNRKKTVSAALFQAYNSSTGILPLPTNPNPQAFVAHHVSQFNNQGRNVERNYQNTNRGNHKNCGNYRFNIRINNYSRNTTQRFNRGARNNYSSNKKILCQICCQFNHEAYDCPHRMDQNYGGKSSHSAMVANTSHSTPTWIIDSGASSHMTNSYANLQNPEPYHGPEQVYIGDGKGLPILHSSSSCLHTPHNSFAMKHVLHVPDLKLNLLSANQFLLDNWCSMHLYPFHFTMKDLSSRGTLFKGPVQHGFCSLHLSSSSPTTMV
ncbi:hypothetical protein ACFX11_030477 [Malus domestica]